MNIEPNKRYFMRTKNVGIVRGRVLHVIPGGALVKLDYWEGEYAVSADVILHEDTDKPSIFKRIIGAHA